jgi:sugar phosphate isomerase/epimerase
VRRHLEIAQQVGAQLLRVVLAGLDWEPSFDESVAFLKGIAPELRAVGVALAIENRFSMLPAELARLVYTLGDPLVGVCLDPLNSITRLVGVDETVRALAPFALSVHAKDAVISRPGAGFYIVGCPLGKGLVDLTGMLDAVRAAGRSPNVFVEGWMDPLEDEESTLAQEELWARDGMAYLRRML